MKERGLDVYDADGRTPVAEEVTHATASGMGVYPATPADPHVRRPGFVGHHPDAHASKSSSARERTPMPRGLALNGGHAARREDPWAQSLDPAAAHRLLSCMRLTPYS